MIRLGKDKIDERYNISDDGTITDSNGNVQETKIIRGRPFFKSQYVHKIQMWTKNEWRDGRTWAIHHKDENPLNNNINNLEFKTHSEHRSLHMTGKHYMLGKKLSKETRKKMSLASKGKPKLKPAWNKDRHGIYSQETLKKRSEAMKGKPGPNKGRHWSEETKKKLSLAHKGKEHSDQTKKKISLAHKGKHWKLDENTGKRIYY